MNLSRFTGLAVLLFFLLRAYPTLAIQSEPPPPASDAREADRDQLRALKAVVEQAMSGDNQIHILRDHVSADFSIVTFTSRQFDDFDTFVDQWNISRDKFLQGGTFAVTIEPKPTVFEGELAICRGDSTNIMVTGNGDRFEFQSPWTAVCRKENGQWKLIRAHSSIDPFSNPVLNASVKKYLWLVGLSSALAGLVLGIASVWLKRKFINRP